MNDDSPWGPGSPVPGTPAPGGSPYTPPDGYGSAPQPRVLPYPDPEQTQYMAPVTHPDGPDPATGAPAGAVRDGQGAEEPPATRLGGPLFRDEYPAPPVGTDAEQTAVLPPIPGTPPPPSSPPPPAPPAQPAPAKPRAGRNLRAAIGVGVALGAAVLLSLFFVKALFVVVVSGAVV